MRSSPFIKNEGGGKNASSSGKVIGMKIEKSGTKENSRSSCR